MNSVNTCWLMWTQQERVGRNPSNTCWLMWTQQERVGRNPSNTCWLMWTQQERVGRSPCLMNDVLSRISGTRKSVNETLEDDRLLFQDHHPVHFTVFISEISCGCVREWHTSVIVRSLLFQSCVQVLAYWWGQTAAYLSPLPSPPLPPPLFTETL